MEINKVMIYGNLTRDPETRQAGQSSVTTFAIASNRKYTTNGEKREEACFVDVEAWGKTGELCAQYLRRGSAAFVEGRLKQETWEDKNGGGKRSKHVLSASSVQFGPKSGNQPDGQTNQQNPSSGQHSASGDNSADGAQSSTTSNEDLPF
jgi:single-strand DNA-binding protein